jgi:hypothetical protein
VSRLEAIFPFLYLNLLVTLWLYTALCRVKSFRKDISVDCIVTTTYHLALSVFVHLCVVSSRVEMVILSLQDLLGCETQLTSIQYLYPQFAVTAALRMT